MTNRRFVAAAVACGLALAAASLLFDNEYYVFAAYFVVQYVVLATAWNLLGGYVGYVNFGTTAFMAIGTYSAAAINKAAPVPIPVLMLVAGFLCAVVGLSMGYLTIRLRGVYFTIATLALSVVVQTFIVNWDYTGGSRGIYVMRPQTVPFVGSYVKYLFMLMVALAVLAIVVARLIEKSSLGYGFAAIRDDEAAAAAAGVPVLRLKLLAASLSGAFMGMAGAPLPFYLTYIEPSSSFSLAYTVNSVAMPLVGGTTSWIGPVLGAILLGSMQQAMTVLVSSSLNLLIVGVLLVLFVVAAPNGLLGLFRSVQRRPIRERGLLSRTLDLKSGERS